MDCKHGSLRIPSMLRMLLRMLHCVLIHLERWLLAVLFVTDTSTDTKPVPCWVIAWNVPSYSSN